MADYRNQIYDYLRNVPKGKVVTYGQIASHLGNKKLARYVGNALHNNPDCDATPCYKAVNAAGQLSAHFAFGGIDAQKCRLEKDGIEVVNYTVDLSKYLFDDNENKRIS